MAGDLLFRKPSLNVIQGDYIGPMYGKVAAAATVTYLIPGKLVSMLTNDGEIDIGGAADESFNVGIIGYEQTPLAYKPATRDTIYAVGDHVAIHNTPGMRFRGFVLNSAAVLPGQRMKHDAADTSGNFKAVVGADENADAIALEPVTASASCTTPTACWMIWLG